MKLRWIRKRNEEPKLQPPSEQFQLAFLAGCSSVAKCKCGLTHVAGQTADEADEILAASNPEEYRYHAREEVILWGSLQGQKFVIGCECLSKWMGIYEQFTVRHERQLNEFLAGRMRHQ